MIFKKDKEEIKCTKYSKEYLVAGPSGTTAYLIGVLVLGMIADFSGTGSEIHPVVYYIWIYGISWVILDHVMTKVTSKICYCLLQKEEIAKEVNNEVRKS